MRLVDRNIKDVYFMFEIRAGKSVFYEVYHHSCAEGFIRRCFGNVCITFVLVISACSEYV